MTLIYDENGQLLWAQRDVPWLMKMIQPDWLKSNGFHEIEADVNDTSLLLSGDHSIQQQLQEVREDDDDAEMTHSVAVNVYPATSRMPKLTIVVVDTIPVELKSSYMVWGHVLLGGSHHDDVVAVVADGGGHGAMPEAVALDIAQADVVGVLMPLDDGDFQDVLLQVDVVGIARVLGHDLAGHHAEFPLPH